MSARQPAKCGVVLGTELGANLIGVKDVHVLLVARSGGGFRQDRFEARAWQEKCREFGGHGKDVIRLVGDGYASGIYEPSLFTTTTLDGNKSYYGRFSGTSGLTTTTIDFSEFRPDGSHDSGIEVVGFSDYFFRAPDDAAADLELMALAPGKQRIQGKLTPSIEFLPITFINLPSLRIRGGLDNPNKFNIDSAYGSDITVLGGRQDDNLNLFRATGNGDFRFDGNAGNDELVVTLASGDDDILFNGGAGDDTLIVKKDSGTHSIQFDGGADHDTLEVEGDGTGPLTNGSITGLTPKPITWNPDTIEEIIVHNGDSRRLVLNNATISGNLLVLEDGVLQGAGTLPALAVGDSGEVKPGTPQFLGFGILNTGNFTLGWGGFFTEIKGDVAGISYDQLKVTGTVSLATAALTVKLDSSYLPAVGTVFAIIANDGTDPISGKFTGYNEGAVLSLNGGATNLRLSYKGGTGNDVTLTVLDSRPVVGSLSTSSFFIKDDNSDFVTLTANDVFSPTGTLDYTYVSFYLDSNGNNALDPNTDRLLGGGQNNHDGSYTWTGLITGVAPRTYRLFASATRYTYHDQLFSDPVSTTIQVNAAPPPVQVASKDGAETRINAFAANYQRTALLGVDAVGNAAVVYVESINLVNSVYLQRYTSTGATLGNRALLSGVTGDLCDIAVSSSGSFVVVWTQNSYAYARRFAADGTVQGATIQVNTLGLVQYDSARFGARAAIDAQGNFIVGWVENVINAQFNSADDSFYRRYSANGTPRDAAPVLAHSSATGIQVGIDLAMNDTGNFVVTWIDSGPAFTYDAKARVSTNGTTLGSEFTVDTRAASVFSLSAAMSSSGDFVIALQSDFVYTRRYASDGTALDSQEVQATPPLVAAYKPLIAMNSAGYFVVAWNVDALDPGDGQFDTGVYGQVFTPNGNKLGGPIHVSTTNTGDQYLTGLAIDSFGNFAASWNGNGPGDTDGVFLQRFKVNLPPVPGSLPTQSVGANSRRTITLPVTDPNGTAITVTHIGTQAISSGGSVNLANGTRVTLNANGTLTYEPLGALAVNSYTSFGYTVSDGVLTATGSVGLKITGPLSLVNYIPTEMLAGTTRIVVQFSEPGVGADLSTNYRLHSVGTDGLLGTADDVVVNFVLSSDGTTSTLDTGGLVPGIYRLQVLDAITDGTGHPFDGDGDGTFGGALVRDFVVGTVSYYFSTPTDFGFHVQIAGAGAGTLSDQSGSSAIVDGNRLQVGSQNFAPPLPPVDVTTAVLNAQVNVNAQAATWQDIPGLSATFTADGNNVVIMTAGLAVQSETTQIFVARILIDGVVPTGGGHFEAYPVYAGVWQEFDFEAAQALAPGSHTVTVQAYWNSGGAVHYDKTPYGIGLLIREFNAFADGTGSVDLASVGISGTQTVTAPAGVFANIPELTTTVTVDGANAVNIHALIGTRSPIEQNFHARILVDGNPTTTGGYVEQYPVPATAWRNFTVDNTLLLSPGVHTIVVQALWSSGGTINYDTAPYSVLSIREFKQTSAGPAVEIYTASSGSQDFATTAAATWLDVPGFTTTFHADNLDTVSIAAQLGVYADNAQDFRARILIDDDVPLVGGYVQRDPLDAKTWTIVAVQATQQLPPGNHTVKLQMYWGSGGHTKVDFTPYSSLNVSLFKGAGEPYQLTDDGRTLITGGQTLAGLEVHREVTVPNTGTVDFARSVEVFTNPTGASVTTPVHLTSNFGVSASSAVFATSDGDADVELTDLWVAFDDADGLGGPAVAYLLDPSAGVTLTALQSVGDNLDTAFQVTVAAGATVRLSHFMIVAQTRAAVLAQLGSLIPSTSVAGLSASQATAAIALSWSALAGGPEVASYDLFVSDNQGPFTLHSTYNTTSTTFTGVPGHSYRFYTLGHNTYGVDETVTGQADATTHVVPLAVSDQYVVTAGKLLTVSAAAGVLSNDAGASTAILVTRPTRGTVTFKPNGSFTYKPSAKYRGDSFSYKVRDASGAESAVAVVSLVSSVGFSVTASRGNEAVTTVKLTVLLTAPASSSVTVNYALTGGTATSGVDFNLLAGTLTFAPGQVSKIITLKIVSDKDIEPNETIETKLSSPTNAVLGAKSVHIYTIVNDDKV